LYKENRKMLFGAQKNKGKKKDFSHSTMFLNTDTDVNPQARVGIHKQK
jgi:hypothetical protein